MKRRSLQEYESMKPRSNFIYDFEPLLDSAANFNF